MDLNSILVSEFAKITNDNKETVNEGTTVYGTYRVDSDGAYVQIDGSDTRTPIATTASAKSGDRVTVLIKNHRAIITGNMTDPSASSETVRTLDLGLGGLNDTIKNVLNSVSDLSGEVDGISTNVTGMAASIEGAKKVATNFLSFEAPYGLIVGDLTGSTLGFNVLIDATSVNMRYNSTILAKYASDTIYLGYNSRESIIDMCNGLATIGPDADYFNRLSIESDYGMSLDASSGPIDISGMRSLLWLDSDGIFLLSNKTQHPGNGTDSSNVGFYLDNDTREINVYGSIVGYSKTTHTHPGYASVNHDHSGDYIYPDAVHCSGNVRGDKITVMSPGSTTKTQAGLLSSSSYGGYLLVEYSGSSKRYKHGFHSLNDELKEKIRKLYDLEVKSWTYNDDYLSDEDELYQTETFGLIAEDVAEVLPEAVYHNDNGDIDNYRDRHILNAMLVLLQEQKKQIDSLECRIEALEKKEA